MQTFIGLHITLPRLHLCHHTLLWFESFSPVPFLICSSSANKVPSVTAHAVSLGGSSTTQFFRGKAHISSPTNFRAGGGPLSAETSSVV